MKWHLSIIVSTYGHLETPGRPRMACMYREVSMQTLCCVNKRSDVHGFWHLKGECALEPISQRPQGMTTSIQQKIHAMAPEVTATLSVSDNCTSSPDPLVSVLWLCEQLLPKFPTNPITVKWLCFLYATSKNYKRWIFGKDQKEVNKKGGSKLSGRRVKSCVVNPTISIKKLKTEKKVKGLYNVKGLNLGLWLDWLNAHLTCSKPWVQSPGPHKEGVVAQACT